VRTLLFARHYVHQTILAHIFIWSVSKCILCRTPFWPNGSLSAYHWYFGFGL